MNDLVGHDILQDHGCKIVHTRVLDKLVMLKR